MAIEALEVRMARLEGGYEQINERLGAIEQRLTSEIGALRAEIASLRPDIASLRSDITSLRSESTSLRSEIATRADVASLRAEMRVGDSDLRKQMTAQFFWLLTFVLGSILVPILRDFAR